jgi:RNA polymerase sigma-70 factor (sigma-E family)
VRDSEYIEYVTAKIPWLRKVAHLLCQDWHGADELTQATITQLYVNWRKVRVADNIDGYARAVLVRVFLAERRTGWARRVRVVEELPEVRTSAPDVATQLMVRRALRAVPARQRATLVLRFYCDLTVEQTAQAMGCSVGTVKSQTARGLLSLRDHLAEADEPGAEQVAGPRGA